MAVALTADEITTPPSDAFIWNNTELKLLGYQVKRDLLFKMGW